MIYSFKEFTPGIHETVYTADHTIIAGVVNIEEYYASVKTVSQETQLLKVKFTNRL